MSPPSSPAKRGLGLAKEAEAFAGGEGLAHDVLVELGILPPGSAARNPEVEQAFQLQRAGEREPVTSGGLGVGAAIPFALSPEIISGASGGGAVAPGFDPAAAQPFEISPEILSGASG